MGYEYQYLGGISGAEHRFSHFGMKLQYSFTKPRVQHHGPFKSPLGFRQNV